MSSGSHELEEAEQAREDDDRTAGDQPRVEGRDFLHLEAEDDSRGEDADHEGNLHEEIEQVVYADGGGVQFVLCE